jgi:hypothetical protein
VKDGNVLEIVVEYDDYLNYVSVSQLFNNALAHRKIVPLHNVDYLEKEIERRRKNEKN